MGGYTPGPWAYEPDVDDDFVITSAGRPLVATVHSGFRDWTESNARLIAAAPTLLEAAQRVTAAFRKLGESRSLIADFELHKECEAAMLALDAAISRATGEGE